MNSINKNSVLFFRRIKWFYIDKKFLVSKWKISISYLLVPQSCSDK